MRGGSFSAGFVSTTLQVGTGRWQDVGFMVPVENDEQAGDGDSRS
jgi:hypothetical protein